MRIQTCQETGKQLNKLEHIRQSLAILLKTPKGSLVHCREFGCAIWEYLDMPLSETVLQQVKMEILQAIDVFEPRVYCERVQVDVMPEGVLNITLSLKYLGTKVEFQTQLQNIAVQANA